MTEKQARETFDQSVFEVGIIVIPLWLVAGIGVIIGRFYMDDPGQELMRFFAFTGAGILFAGGLFKLLQL